MLPTTAEIQAAEQAVTAFGADTAAFFQAPQNAPVAFSAALPATKTSPAPSMDYAAGKAILDGKGKGNIAEYLITEFVVEGGRAFRFEKLKGGTDREAASYDVFIADERTADAGLAFDSCECRGFLRHGHCKHHDAARAIADRTPAGTPTCRKPANTDRDLANDEAYRW